MQLLLYMVIGRFNRPILMGDTPIVARRTDAVMLTQLLKAFRKVVLLCAVLIGRAQAVCTQLARHAAALPEGILQAIG